MVFARMRPIASRNRSRCGSGTSGSDSHRVDVVLHGQVDPATVHSEKEAGVKPKKFLEGMIVRCPSCRKLTVSFHVLPTERPPLVFLFACKCGAQYAREAMQVS